MKINFNRWWFTPLKILELVLLYLIIEALIQWLIFDNNIKGFSTFTVIYFSIVLFFVIITDYLFTKFLVTKWNIICQSLALISIVVVYWMFPGEPEALQIELRSTDFKNFIIVYDPINGERYRDKFFHIKTLQEVKGYESIILAKTPLTVYLPLTEIKNKNGIISDDYERCRFEEQINNKTYLIDFYYLNEYYNERECKSKFEISGIYKDLRKLYSLNK